MRENLKMDVSNVYLKYCFSNVTFFKKKKKYIYKYKLKYLYINKLLLIFSAK